MEASQAGQGPAGGDTAAQGAQNDGGESTEGMTPAQVAEMFGQLQGGQDELRQALQTIQQQSAPADPAEPGEPAEPENLDLTFMDPSDPYFNPEQAAERLGGLIEQVAASRAEALVKESVNPLSEQVAEMRRQNEAQALVAEFPELGEEGVANEVVAVSRQIAEAQNRPELADEPWFWRMTYMASKAAETAQAEGGATPPAANLEGGGGAVPGGGGGKDLGDEIVGARRQGAGVLPFA